MRTALKSCRDGGEEAPPFLFVARMLELVSYLAHGLTNALMLTTVDGME